MMPVSVQSYVCSDGDVLDAVVTAHYGSRDARELEIVLEANPGLALKAGSLSAGDIVLLPVIVAPAVTGTVSLWD
jgi:phage tail protein X